MTAKSIVVKNSQQLTNKYLTFSKVCSPKGVKKKSRKKLKAWMIFVTSTKWIWKRVIKKWKSKLKNSPAKKYFNWLKQTSQGNTSRRYALNHFLKKSSPSLSLKSWCKKPSFKSSFITISNTSSKSSTRLKTMFGWLIFLSS